MYALSIARNDSEGSLTFLSSVLSCFAAGVTMTNSGAPDESFITVCALTPPFFLPSFGFLPAPFITSVKRETVVESMT